MTPIYSYCRYCNRPAPLKTNIRYLEIWKAIDSVGGMLEKIGSTFMVASGLSTSRKTITAIVWQNKTIGEALGTTHWHEFSLLAYGVALNFTGSMIQYHVDLVDCSHHRFSA